MKFLEALEEVGDKLLGGLDSKTVFE